MGVSLRQRPTPERSPPWVTLSLRILGYLCLFISLYMMWAMIPRPWTNQVELPARTVAHLVIGIAIGAILILKISIVRFFKYLEKAIVPMLGVGLFICTVILVGLAMPSYAREAYLNRAAFSPERQARLDGQIERAGLTDPTERLPIGAPPSSAWPIARLLSPRSKMTTNGESPPI